MTIRIIAEIGINHRGSVEKAKDLIDKAVLANCWGVKFQFRDIATFYQSTDEIGDGILLEELQRTELSASELEELASYARHLGIKVGLSFFRVSDLAHAMPLVSQFDFLKVPSAECTNTPLIDAMLSTGKLVMVSTGGHSTDQIENALSKYSDAIVVFHCVANYPVKLGAQNFSFIHQLQKMGFGQVGYSSHDENIEATIMSMAYGVQWIERHLTDDVGGIGLDDSSSSELDDFLKLSAFSENIDGLIGSGSHAKVVNQGEQLNMQNLGTGLYARDTLRAGTVPSLADFDIQAPRKGLSVGEFLQEYQRYDLKRSVNVGSALEAVHYLEQLSACDPSVFEFAFENRVGIPVRLHDFQGFRNAIPIGVYEFHLSYQEALTGDFGTAISHILPSDRISIHLPDYLPGNRIVDPVSDNTDVRVESRQLIERVLEFADYLTDRIGVPVPIVGSFSQTNGRSRYDALDDIFSYLDSDTVKRHAIFPQWLPVFAWYFGGSVKLSLFNSEEDISYIERHQGWICLDLCHLVLSANSSSVPWRAWYERLKSYTGHLHFADAVGVDGEGLQLGTGDIGCFSGFLDSDVLKIIEVWQGHHNGGRGFLEALSVLSLQSNNMKDHV